MTSKVTINYGLPQYQLKDHPDFLDEINKAYRTIDETMYELANNVIEQKEELAILQENVMNLQDAVAKLTSMTVGQKGE